MATALERFASGDEEENTGAEGVTTPPATPAAPSAPLPDPSGVESRAQTALSRFSAASDEDLQRLTGDVERAPEIRYAAESELQGRGGGGGARVSEQMASEREQFLLSQIPAQPGEQRPTELGEPGLRDFMARFSTGFSNRVEEKVRVLRRRFPEGNVVVVRDQPLVTGRDPGEERRSVGPERILLRRFPDERYFELDARATDEFELLYDIADFSGELPIILGEILAFKGAGRAVGAAGEALRSGWVSTAVRGLIGGSTGEVAREQVDTIRGVQEDTIREIATGAGAVGLMSGGFAAVGGVTGDAAINTVRGRGAIANRTGADLAVGAAGRLGVNSPLPSEVNSSPLVQRIARQSAAVSDIIDGYVRDREVGMARAIAGMTDEDLQRFLADDLIGLHQDARREILAGIVTTRASSLDAGLAIRAGVAQFDRVSRATTDRLYARARDMGTPEFDVPRLRTAAEDALRQVRGATDPELVAQGAPATTVLDEPDSQLADVARRLLMLDPSLPPVNGVDATTQLRAIRSGLYHLRGIDGEPLTPTNRRARDLYNELTEVIENPTNLSDEAGDAWSNAWREANRSHRIRRETMDTALAREAIISENAQDLAFNLARPGQAERIQLAQAMLPSERWNEFRSFFTDEVLRKGEGGSHVGALSRFDMDTLRSVYTDSEIETLRRIAGRLDSLESANVTSIYARLRRGSSIAKELLMGGNEVARRDILSRVAQPGNADLRRGLAASLIDDLFENSVRRVGDEIVGVDQSALASQVDAMRRAGLLDDLFTPEEASILRDAQVLAQFFDNAVDAGTSIQGMEVASGVFSGSPRAIMDYWRLRGIGWALTTPGVQGILSGRGRPRTHSENLRLISGILGAEIASLNKAAENEETGNAGRFDPPEY